MSNENDLQAAFNKAEQRCREMIESGEIDPKKTGTITPWSAVVHEDVLQATHDRLATGLTVQDLIDAGIWKRMDEYGNLMLVADLDNDDTAS